MRDLVRAEIGAILELCGNRLDVFLEAMRCGYSIDQTRSALAVASWDQAWAGARPR